MGDTTRTILELKTVRIQSILNYDDFARECGYRDWDHYLEEEEKRRAAMPEGVREVLEELEARLEYLVLNGR